RTQSNPKSNRYSLFYMLPNDPRFSGVNPFSSFLLPVPISHLALPAAIANSVLLAAIPFVSAPLQTCSCSLHFAEMPLHHFQTSLFCFPSHFYIAAAYFPAAA